MWHVPWAQKQWGCMSWGTTSWPTHRLGLMGKQWSQSLGCKSTGASRYPESKAILTVVPRASVETPIFSQELPESYSMCRVCQVGDSFFFSLPRSRCSFPGEVAFLSLPQVLFSIVMALRKRMDLLNQEGRGLSFLSLEGWGGETAWENNCSMSRGTSKLHASFQITFLDKTLALKVAAEPQWFLKGVDYLGFTILVFYLILEWNCPWSPYWELLCFNRKVRIQSCWFS